jgi:hypothetical protein
LLFSFFSPCLESANQGQSGPTPNEIQLQMLAHLTSRSKFLSRFEDVRQQHLQATRDGRRTAGPDRLIKDPSVHNATVRLETAERMSETTSKITGSWAEADRHGTGQPPVRNTGQHSNRVFTVSLHKQQHFHEGCVKPHLRLDTAEGIVAEFDELKRPFYDRLVGERDWKYKPPVPPMAWKPETAKAKRPPSFGEPSSLPGLLPCRSSFDITHARAHVHFRSHPSAPRPALRFQAIRNTPFRNPSFLSHFETLAGSQSVDATPPAPQ